MFGVGQDFTTLRQAVFEVSSAADDMKRIVEYANAPIFGIDADGKITEWNRKLTEISEYTQEELHAVVCRLEVRSSHDRSVRFECASAWSMAATHAGGAVALQYGGCGIVR